MKIFKDYKLIIVDLDGTLYYQKPLRIKMAFSLLFHYSFRPHKLKELFVIKDYRKIREKAVFNNQENIEDNIVKTLCDKYKKDGKKIVDLIDFWMVEKPKKYIKKYQDKNLIDMLKNTQEEGVKIVVYSDNPATEKMKAIDLCVDDVFSAGDKDICCFKPENKGLKAIISKFNISYDKVLFIGDRQEKDGKCAESLGVDYIILSSKKRKRNKQLGVF